MSSYPLDEMRLITPSEAEWFRQYRSSAVTRWDVFCGDCRGGADCCRNAPAERPRSFMRRLFAKGPK